MRLFIAINFNTETKSRLLALRDGLRSKSGGGNFSLPENLHLTLVFLGECDAREAAAIKSVMDAVSFEPFEIAIDRVGRFRRDDGDIWWAGVKESKALAGLQRELQDRLTEVGFYIENRKYSPHITLGRRVITDEKPWGIEAFGEKAAGIDLMLSERVNGRLTYSVIHHR